jgi:hypothetical protein
MPRRLIDCGAQRSMHPLRAVVFLLICSGCHLKKFREKIKSDVNTYCRAAL